MQGRQRKLIRAGGRWGQEVGVGSVGVWQGAFGHGKGLVFVVGAVDVF